MNEASVLQIGREGLWTILLLAGPILLAGLGIGLIIALFQALTSIQEMTLAFVPKILVVFAAIIVFLPFMMRTMIEFGQELFTRAALLGG